MVNGLELDSKPFKDSLAVSFWRALAETPCIRIGWKPDFASGEALRASVQPLRKRLVAAVGAPLPPASFAMQPVMVFRGVRYTIERIVVGNRVPGTTSFAFLARPSAMNEKSAVIVLLHGSGMHPQEAFNWHYPGEYRRTERFENSAFVGAALELVEAGYTVYIPWLADDASTDYWPLL
jgi:hypothetical protein